MTRLRELRPGAVEVTFGIVLAVGLVAGRHGFLNDPGTYWHDRLGRELLQAGHLPRVDELSFTRLGAPWVDQSWGFDALLAAIVGRWGWGGAVAATAVGLAWIYGTLTRGLIRAGASPFAATAATLAAAGIGAIHFHARPHLFTFAFVLGTLSLCRAYHERKGRSIWLVPFLMVAWANLHGGFLAGPLIVATAAVGHAISGPWDAGRRRGVITLVAVAALSTITPLLNPYGLGLYRHVVGLLVTSRVTDLIREYNPVRFGEAESRLLELVVLSLIALPAFGKARPSRYEQAHVVVWLHLALTSIRHAPLFALAAAPTLARLIDGVRPVVEDGALASKRWPAWPALASLAVLLAVALGIIPGGPNPATWPIAALPALDREPADARVFHEQDWGGFFEDFSRPARLAYIDDRFELWGRAPVLEYLAALEGGEGWEAVRERSAITHAWLRPSRGLARQLLGDPRWEVVRRDEVSILFRRKGTGSDAFDGPGLGRGPGGGRPVGTPGQPRDAERRRDGQDDPGVALRVVAHDAPSQGQEGQQRRGGLHGAGPEPAREAAVEGRRPDREAGHAHHQAADDQELTDPAIPDARRPFDRGTQADQPQDGQGQGPARHAGDDVIRQPSPRLFLRDERADGRAKAPGTAPVVLPPDGLPE